MCLFLTVGDSTCPVTLTILTASVIEERGSDGALQLSVGVPTAQIQEARAMITRVGKENSPAGSSFEKTNEIGRQLCHPSVWALATARPIELCPNHGCGVRHILADCEYESLCTGCGATGHVHVDCTIKCSWCHKHHSFSRCPKRGVVVRPLIPRRKNQGSR